MRTNVHNTFKTYVFYHTTYNTICSRMFWNWSGFKINYEFNTQTMNDTSFNKTHRVETHPISIHFVHVSSNVLDTYVHTYLLTDYVTINTFRFSYFTSCKRTYITQYMYIDRNRCACSARRIYLHRCNAHNAHSFWHFIMCFLVGLSPPFFRCEKSSF